jgi:hypothetical protein
MLACAGKCKCGTKLEKGNTIIEHSTPLALGGLDVLANKYLQCNACADLKTFGRSKATSYGSDIHAIAKVKRLRGERKPKPPSRSFRKPEGYVYDWKTKRGRIER